MSLKLVLLVILFLFTGFPLLILSPQSILLFMLGLDCKFCDWGIMSRSCILLFNLVRVTRASFYLLLWRIFLPYLEFSLTTFNISATNVPNGAFQYFCCRLRIPPQKNCPFFATGFSNTTTINLQSSLTVSALTTSGSLFAGDFKYLNKQYCSLYYYFWYLCSQLIIFAISASAAEKFWFLPNSALPLMALNNSLSSNPHYWHLMYSLANLQWLHPILTCI